MSDETTTPQDGDQQQARRQKLEAIAALGLDPWGQRLDDHTPIGRIRERADEVRYTFEDGSTVEIPDFDAQGDSPSTEKLNFRQWKADQNEAHDGQRGELVGPECRVAGRIKLHRNKGKLHFVDITDMTGRIQLMVGQKQVGDDWPIVENLDLGDLIAVDGMLTVTNTGELSVAATRVHFLAKSLEPPPEKHHGLTDPEMRQRMRYVDLAYNDGVMDRFLARTRIVRSVRETLNAKGFVEVEGPTLHSIAGGAAARPFTTHHNALDMPLFMRIALELHLKRLLVGGIERVYELGRVYRNEGISPRHNPEFTMLEVYQAYGDYRSMMDLTEGVICDAIKANAECGMRSAEGQPGASATGPSYVLPWGDKTIDFTPPFERKTYNELFEQHAGVDPT
ncbi:MAG: amino acid--tRNA ligase-related protein, partial [Planctomycetota bacterium]